MCCASLPPTPVQSVIAAFAGFDILLDYFQNMIENYCIAIVNEIRLNYSDWR